jgi:hypothetical protein
MFKNRKRGDSREISPSLLSPNPALGTYGKNRTTICAYRKMPSHLLADKFWHVATKHINHNPPAKIRNLSVDKNLEGKKLPRAAVIFQIRK